MSNNKRKHDEGHEIHDLGKKVDDPDPVFNDDNKDKVEGDVADGPEDGDFAERLEVTTTLKDGVERL